MWKKRLDRILNTVMGSAAGVFVGYGAYVVWDYKTHPGPYAMRSAPWYSGILTYGCFAAAALLLGIALKRMLRKRAEK